MLDFTGFEPSYMIFSFSFSEPSYSWGSGVNTILPNWPPNYYKIHFNINTLIISYITKHMTNYISNLLNVDMETNECLHNNGGCWKDANLNITACKVNAIQLSRLQLQISWPMLFPNWSTSFNCYLTSFGSLIGSY
jgi:hypothetical protein